MIPEQWEHFYREICLDLGIDPLSDLESSSVLSTILGDDSRIELLDRYRGGSFYVIGNGPNLPEAIGYLGTGTTIVADSALGAFLDTGKVPDIVVTDLDGGITSLRRAFSLGSIMVIHSHGDNGELLRKYAHEFSGRAVGTTQNKPQGKIYNFFGFTDGDRGAYLADFLGAEDIFLVGFDFSMPGKKRKSAAARKMKKLKWAKVLLEELAMERGTTLESGPIIPL